MTVATEIQQALHDLAITDKQEKFTRFFKAGKGEYAEGDQFIGVSVPDQRKIVKAYYNKIHFDGILELLSSPIHEFRHVACLILVAQFEKSKEQEKKKEIVDFYLQHKQYFNNWDLVDCSCYKILGRYYFDNQDESVFRNLSNEDHLWSKRMAIVSTMYHVKKGQFLLTKELALNNLQHEHDLMHKANGWLLREMGNIDEQELVTFLKEHYKKMPRTSLRYAIEKLDEDLRQDFLKGRI